MKKVIFIMMAALAFSCGDGSNRSSESGSGTNTEDSYSNDAVESDSTSMQSDTTSSPGMDRQGQPDTTSANPQ